MGGDCSTCKGCMRQSGTVCVVQQKGLYELFKSDGGRRSDSWSSSGWAVTVLVGVQLMGLKNISQPKSKWHC